jgi:flagellar biosynthesis GTPase FlhF
MLRTTANSLSKTTSWRSSAIFSSVRQYTTPADVSTTPAAENKKQTPLSQRIGGTGRGKVMEGATDPFASFLANARKPRTNNNNNSRNGNFTPRPRRQNTENKGQFADATTESTTNNDQQQQQQQQRKPRMRTEGNNNSNKNRNNNRPNRQQKTEGSSPQDNNNNRRQPRENTKRVNFRAKSQPQEVRTRRATTFIDKDIDWSSFETATLSNESTEQVIEDSNELVLKDIAGDYDRYLGVGSDIKWPETMQGVNTLVGSNPTLDLQQKTAFLAALSSATGGNAVGARK